jgi:hypothetical protein
LCALALREHRQQLVLDRINDLVELSQLTPPRRCERDEVAAPVGRVDAPLHEPARCQIVDDCDDVASVEAATAAELDLARGPELVECGQKCKLRAGRAGGREPFGAEPLRVQRGLAEEPTRPSAEAGGRLEGIDRLRISRLLVSPTVVIVGSTNVGIANECEDDAMTETTAPSIYGQFGLALAFAERTLTAVLREHLAERNTEPETWYALQLVATRGPGYPRAALSEALEGSPNLDAQTTRELLARLESEGLIRGRWLLT